MKGLGRAEERRESLSQPSIAGSFYRITLVKPICSLCGITISVVKMTNIFSASLTNRLLCCSLLGLLPCKELT